MTKISKYYFKTFVELEVEVEVHFAPGIPETRYLRNGDPGYPAEPPEYEISSVKLVNGDEEIKHLLSEKEINQLLIEAEETNYDE